MSAAHLGPADLAIVRFVHVHGPVAGLTLRERFRDFSRRRCSLVRQGWIESWTVGPQRSEYGATDKAIRYMAALDKPLPTAGEVVPPRQSNIWTAAVYTGQSWRIARPGATDAARIASRGF